jgi:hypothetical protein
MAFAGRRLSLKEGDVEPAPVRQPHRHQRQMRIVLPCPVGADDQPVFGKIGRGGLESLGQPMPASGCGPAGTRQTGAAPMRVERAARQLVRDGLAPLVRLAHHSALDREQLIGEARVVRQLRLFAQRMAIGPQADQMHRPDRHQHDENGAQRERVELTPARGRGHRALRRTSGANR